MKKILCAALAAAFIAGTAHAQSWGVAKVPLVFVRNSTGSDNPNPTSSNYATYKIGLSNGNHNSANNGVAISPQDTSDAIPVFDHALKFWQYAKTAAALPPNDSTYFGTLVLQGTSGTIDSVMIFKDVSTDGVTWTVQDSIGGHIMSNVAQIVTGAVSDSAQFVMGAQANATGNVARKIGLAFSVIPQVNLLGVTAQAFQSVNYVRFRLHMTAGDYAVAGANNGVSGYFTYPSVQIPGINQ